MRAKVALFVAGQLAVSAAVGVAVARAGAPVGSPLAILALAVAFAGVSKLDMHLEFRRNQMTLTLAEAVVVIAFFTVGPVGAGAAAGLGELLWRLARLFPRGALNGPYRSDGREWMQWMARGAGLVCDLLPAVEPVLRTGIDPHVLGRLNSMQAGARAYMDGVRARDASTAYYRAPREKLTVAG